MKWLRVDLKSDITKKSLWDQQAYESVKVLKADRELKIEVEFTFLKEKWIFNLGQKMNTLCLFISPQ